jgi:hypothetical protein
MLHNGIESFQFSSSVTSLRLTQPISLLRLDLATGQETITKNKGSKEVEEAQCTFTHITDLPIGTSNIMV